MEAADIPLPKTWAKQVFSVTVATGDCTLTCHLKKENATSDVTALTTSKKSKKSSDDSSLSLKSLISPEDVLRVGVVDKHDCEIVVTSVVDAVEDNNNDSGSEEDGLSERGRSKSSKFKMGKLGFTPEWPLGNKKGAALYKQGILYFLNYTLF